MGSRGRFRFSCAREEVPGEVSRPRRRKTMEYLRDGSGNEGEGGTVAVREGRSTRREVARKLKIPVYIVFT